MFGLNAPLPRMSSEQREQKQRLERHHEMADRHQCRAEHHGPALAEHAVGEQAAEDRREIDEGGVKAVDMRGERLHAERPEQEFETALERRVADDGFGAPGCEQILDHVEHEQRAHPVIGEALPHLGREQKGKSARMAEKVARSGCGECGHVQNKLPWPPRPFPPLPPR